MNLQPGWVKQKAFTLVELVIVIVVMGILAAGTTSYIAFSTQSYLDLVERQTLGQRLFIITEKLNRIFRAAIPNSIRSGSASGASCIEWIPIIDSGYYFSAPIGSPGREITVIEDLNGSYPSVRLALYPLVNDADSLYVLSTSGRITVDPITQSDPTPGDSMVDLDIATGVHRFPEASPQNRFFLIDNPRLICIDNGNLFLYQNYGFQNTVAASIAARPSTTPNRQLIANGLNSSLTNFSFAPGYEQVNAIVTLQIALTSQDSGDQVIKQEVHIRNVP